MADYFAIREIEQLDDEINDLVDGIGIDIIDLEEAEQKQQKYTYNILTRMEDIFRKIEMANNRIKTMKIELRTVTNRDQYRRYKPVIRAHKTRLEDYEKNMKWILCTDRELSLGTMERKFFNYEEERVYELIQQIEKQTILQPTEYIYHSAEEDRDFMLISHYLYCIHQDLSSIPRCVIDICYSYYSVYPIYNVIENVNIAMCQLQNMEIKLVDKKREFIINMFRNKLHKCWENIRWVDPKTAEELEVKWMKRGEGIRDCNLPLTEIDIAENLIYYHMNWKRGGNEISRGKKVFMKYFRRLVRDKFVIFCVCVVFAVVCVVLGIAIYKS
eukprot:204732_1